MFTNSNFLFSFLEFSFLFVNVTGLLYLPYWYLDNLFSLLLLVNITSLLNLNEMFWQRWCVMPLKHMKLKLIYWETHIHAFSSQFSDEWFIIFDMFWIHGCVSAKPVTGLNMRVLLRDSADSQLGWNVCECVCVLCVRNRNQIREGEEEKKTVWD